MEHKEAPDRDTAIKIMQKLLDQSIIHHGTDKEYESDEPALINMAATKENGTNP